MPHERTRFGDWGEEYARRFLEQKGYSIIEAKYRGKYGEIDLVAWEGECLVFVEVKSRRSRAFGRPEESVTAAKQQKLVQSAQEYIQAKGHEGREWYRRGWGGGDWTPTLIDVVGIEAGGPRPRVQLIRNAVG